jgi:medium-chain acyl-CoA synthetase
MNIKKLIPIQWGHQEAPAKFNFASDVIDHWASVEKVRGYWMEQLE